MILRNVKRTIGTNASVAYLSSSNRMVSNLTFQLQNPNLLPKTETDDLRKTFGVYNPGASSTNKDDTQIATLGSMDRYDTKAIIDKSASVLESWKDRTTASKRS